MGDVAENLAVIRERMAASCRRAGRDVSDVELMVVSKTFGADRVREAIEAGQVLFGESKQQEAEPKIAELPGGLRWHFIGHLQRNKVRKVLSLFEAFHSVDSLRLAQHMNQVAEQLGLVPSVFLQVDVASEETKFGFDSEELRSSMESLLSLSHLKILGLMAIPPEEDTAEQARRWFAKVRETRDRLAAEFGVPLSGLSMGMSGDYEIAIEEGSTMVRVGSAVFGKRLYPAKHA